MCIRDRIYVDYNSVVKKGELIAEMDKVTLQSELQMCIRDSYWVDERCVPPGDDPSNFGLAPRLLLGKVGIPASHYYRIVGEGAQMCIRDRAYVGRSYKYTDRAKALGEDNFSTHRVSVGFIWQMPVC